MNGLARFYLVLAKRVSRWAGRPATFTLALGTIAIWLITGPLFGFSDTWQLVINTGTTIITFLMVFLIQNTQNRDTMALQLKLDELIRATQGAHNALLDLEELDEETLAAFREAYEALAREARANRLRGRSDTGTPAAPLGASAKARARREKREG
jgi:low affinity Fe/Cu permease